MEDERFNEPIIYVPYIFEVTPEVFDEFIRVCENPPPSSQKLIDLMRANRAVENWRKL